LSNSQSSCPSLPSVGIIGMLYHIGTFKIKILFRAGRVAQVVGRHKALSSNPTTTHTLSLSLSLSLSLQWRSAWAAWPRLWI
jgi:hypothetical protein